MNRYERFSSAVEIPIAVLSVAWLVLLVVPYLVSLSSSTSLAFSAVDYVLWGVFVLEYVIKLYLVEGRREFVRSHKLDLATVVVPFLRPLRIVRIIRLARGSSVAGDALTRAKKALTRHNLHFVILIASLVVLGAAGAEYTIENHAPGSNIHSFGAALWWAIVTVTTVGYGDYSPVTVAGRCVAVVLMLVGIGLIGVITANVASAFVTKDQDEALSYIVTVNERLARIERLLEAKVDV